MATAVRELTKDRVTRVVIADGHPLILDGLTSVIDATPGMKVVGRAVDGRGAVALCREHQPHVALFDLHMPSLGGAEVTELLARTSPATAVIVLSVSGRENDVHHCFQAGARGCFFKSAPAADILTAIRAVANGKRYVPAEMGEWLAGRMPASGLTNRETDVLQELVRGKSNKDIAAELGLRESTVKWYVNTVLSKLGVEDRLQAVLQALRMGLVSLDD